MVSKLFALGAVLLASAIADIFDSSRTNISSAATENAKVETAVLDDPWLQNPADDAVWKRARDKGENLMLGMTFNLPEAGWATQPIISPWDGTLKHELELWGYQEFDNTPERCDLEEDGEGFQDMLKELGADHRDVRLGGDNICHTIWHRDGATVEKDENGNIPLNPADQYYPVRNCKYRATSAQFTIAINPKAGIIFFLYRSSPANMAKAIWGVDSVSPDQLPALRSSSDIAWGLWNRHSQGSLSNINYFFSSQIVNRETLTIITRAMNNKKQDRLLQAPGYTFKAGTPEFFALIGSPNLKAAAWFVAQHKAQFGHSRYISEVRVFQPNNIMLPQVSMLVKVERAPTPPKFPSELIPPEMNADSGRAKRRQSKGKLVASLDIDSEKDVERVDLTHEDVNVVRRHVIWV